MFRFRSGRAYGNVVIVRDQEMGEILSAEIRAKPGEERSRRGRRRKRREEDDSEEEELIIETFVVNSVENNRR